MAAKKVIIDTDPGVDDILALALAFRSPELSVEAVTVVSGNVEVDQCLCNALLTLNVLGAPDVPVARGANRPLVADPVFAKHVHGSDGIGGVSRAADELGNRKYPPPSRSAVEGDATDLILDRVRKAPGEITIIALGPLTNIAIALERDPGAIAAIRRLIVMGGSFSGMGNVTAKAEFNFYADPLAAQRVITSGLPTTLVGLDVTQQVILLEDALLARVEDVGTPAARFLSHACGHSFAFSEQTKGFRGIYLHDPLAVAVAIDPSLVETLAYPVDIETEGQLTRGMLVADMRLRLDRSEGARTVDCCVRVDAKRMLEMFLERLG